MSEKQLQHLFEIRLKYNPDTPPVSMNGKVGEYIGSGEGTIKGLKINGKAHWTLFEAQNETVCQSNLFGVMTTDDDAEIKFDTMGFFRRPDEGSHIWGNSSGVSFDTEDDRYQWLNDVMGVWEGEFDSKSYLHRYQVYARST